MTVAALAYDVGMMLVERRDSQNAADAAALAGARYIFEADCVAPTWTCTKARAAALAVAADNGFVDSDPDEDVVLHIPPVNGRYEDFPNFIEVDIDSERDSIFAGVIGRATWPVGTFAVATNDQDLTFPFSMLALNPSKCKAIKVEGTGTVTAYGNIHSNSDGSEAGCGGIGLSRTGGGTINIIADDATCRSGGDILDNGAGTMTCTKVENSFSLPDPLRNLNPPAMPSTLAPAMVQISTPPRAIPRRCPGSTTNPPTMTQTQPCDVGGNGSSYAGHKWLLSPGLYPAGISVTNGATAYLLPGIYWIGGGGFQTSGNASVISVASQADAVAGTWSNCYADPQITPCGVMLYNASLPTSAGGPISLGGSGATILLRKLSLPEANPDSLYNDLVVFQARDNTSTFSANGSSAGADIDGVIYVPKGLVKLNGNGGSLSVDQVIADSFEINGNGGNITIWRETSIDAIIIAAGLVD